MIRNKKTRDVQLDELNEKLKSAQQKEPLGFNAQISEISYRILRIKKSMNKLLQDEQYHLIGLMMEHAYHLKNGIRDSHVAKNTYEKILVLDKSNPDANYRYAFLHYEARNWSTAINHFQQAIQNNDSEFPLSADQKVKANLFIGYCSIMLATESLKVAEGLNEEFGDVETEGISIDKLATRVKEMLNSSKYYLTTNKTNKLMSKEEYDELVELEIKDNELLLNMTPNEPLIKGPSEEVNISWNNAVLLKRLLLENGALSWSAISGYQEESIAEKNDISWDNYRQKVRRINQKLVESGMPEKVIKKDPTTTSYKIEEIQYYIIEYDAK